MVASPPSTRTWCSALRAIPNFQESLSSQPTSPLFETATQAECGSKGTKRKVLILTQKSCFHEVLQKHDSQDTEHGGGGVGGCQGDLKYRCATILNESTPGAKRGEGVSHSEPTVALILKWKKKKRSKEKHRSAMGRQGS